MCGISVFNGFPGKTANPMNLKFLLLFNEERGKDSMGFYSQESGIIKKKGKPRELFSEKEFTIPTTNMFLGHVRSGSSGPNDNSSAHPFQHGNIVLVMNGTLEQHWPLCTKLGIDHGKIHVDSDALCAMLNKTQTKEPLTLIEGSCACVYIDTTTNKMYAYRNIERPLFRGFTEEGMYISSTKESLEAINCTKCEEFKQDVLYEIQDGKILTTYKVKRYIKPYLPVLRRPVTNEQVLYDLDNKIYYREIDLSFNFKHLLIRKWLSPKFQITLGLAEFYPDKRYLVMVPRNHLAMEISVYHRETDAIYSLPLASFSNKEYVLSTGCHVFAVEDIIYNDKSKGAFCKKYDMCRVEGTSETYSKKHKGLEYSIVSVVDNKRVAVDEKNSVLFRVATKKEIDEYWDNLYPDMFGANNSIPVVETKTPQEKFKSELENTVIESYEDLCTLTMDNVEDITQDLIDLNKTGNTTKVNIEGLVNKLATVVEYYNESKAVFETYEK